MSERILRADDRGRLRLMESASSGTNRIDVRAPANVTADTVLTLPDGAGAAGQFLKTDGAGNLSWGTESTGSLQSAYDSAPGIVEDATGPIAVSTVQDQNLLTLDQQSPAATEDVLVIGNSGLGNTLSVTGPSEFIGNLLMKGTRPFTDVRAWGAAGDGAADDTAEIQAAIDAMAAVGGGIVFFPHGNYLTGQLIIKSGVSLVGSGISATTITGTADLNTSVLRCFETGSNMSISNLTVDANKRSYGGAPSPTEAGAIRIFHATNVSVDNVRIYDAIDHAIEVKQIVTTSTTKNISLSRITIDTTVLQGIAILGGEGVRIRDFYITTTGSAGIDIEPAGDNQLVKGVVISNGYIVDAGSYGIAGTLTSVTTKTAGGYRDIHVSNVTVRDNSQSSAGDFIRIVDFDNVTVTNCVGELADSGLYSGAGHGFVFGGITHPANDYAISNLVSKNAGKAGLYLLGASGKEFSRPSVSNICIENSNTAAGSWHNFYVSSYVQDLVASGINLGSRTAGAGGAQYTVGATSMGNIGIQPIRGQGDDLASAGTLTIPDLFESYYITGSTTISTISGGWKGRKVTFFFAGILGFGDGLGNIIIGSGGAGVTTNANAVIEAYFDGTNWLGLAHSTNT